MATVDAIITKESKWPQYALPSLIESCPLWLSSFSLKATESISNTFIKTKSSLPALSASHVSQDSTAASTDADNAVRSQYRVPPKKVCFSTMEDEISYEITPEDMKHSWNVLNVPRTLNNIDMISRHRGIAVSYSAAAHTPGKTCMVHIEPTPLIAELVDTKDRHKNAVFEEQARQREEGDADVDKLAEIARRYSRWGVELA
eukprot:885118_1